MFIRIIVRKARQYGKEVTITVEQYKELFDVPYITNEERLMETKKKAVEVPKITLLQAFEQITTIITQLKNGSTTADLASANLTSLAGRVNTEIPGVFKVPTLEELQTIKKEPKYESSYNDSNCW